MLTQQALNQMAEDIKTDFYYSFNEKTIWPEHVNPTQAGAICLEAGEHE